MKRQMRLVLQAVKENKPELIVQLQNDSLREIIEAPRKLSRPVDFPRVSSVRSAGSVIRTRASCFPRAWRVAHD
jgi:hypothetical protein